MARAVQHGDAPLLVIAGATVNAESERQTARDSTVGPDRPAGERGAVVADEKGTPATVEQPDAPQSSRPADES